jgi:hypothetical protein
MLSAALLQHSLEGQGDEEGAEEWLILYEPRGASDELKATMFEVARRVRTWKRIIWAADELGAAMGTVGTFRQKEFHYLCDQLKILIGVDRADEIWCTQHPGYAERLISDLFPDAKVYLYEDGFLTYVPYVPYVDKTTGGRYGMPIRMAKQLKAYLDGFIPSKRFYHNSSRYLNRIANQYLFIANDIPVPSPYSSYNHCLIKPDVLCNVLSTCASLPDVVSATNSVLDPAGRYAMVMSQTFYKSGMLTWDQEASVYEKITSGLVASGYKVLWKEHPRSDRPFYTRVEAVIGKENISLSSLPYTLPIECIAPHVKIDAWLASGSSSLYYLSRVYGAATFTFADEMIPYLVGNHRIINQMTTSLVPLASNLWAK